MYLLFLARGGVGGRRRREAQPSTANTGTFESERTDFGGQCGVGWWRPHLSAIPFTFAHICSRRQITHTRVGVKGIINGFVLYAHRRK